MDENRPSGRPGASPEQRDVNTRAVTKAGIGLALLVVGSLFLVWLVFDMFLRRPADQPRVSPGAAQDVRRLPPEPRLQATPTEDLQQMLAAERRILNSYAWLDGNQTFARIPVSVAMDVVAQRGLPAQPPPPPASVSVPRESGLGPIVHQVGGPLNPNRVFPPRQPLEIRGGQAGGPPTPADRSLANTPEGLTK